jgi:hypothetical protein
MLKKHSNLKDLFALLRAELAKDGVDVYTTATSVRFKKDTVFAKLHFRKKYIQLELKVGENNIKDKEFVYWRQGESPWGWTHVYPDKVLSKKVIKWIKIARNYSEQVSEEN